MIRLPLLFLTILCLFADANPARSQQGKAAQPASAAQAAAEAQSQALERAQEKLDTVDKQATHLEQSVMIMLAVDTLVIAIIAGTTIGGELRVIDAIKRIEREATEVRQRFPKLTGIETQARNALSSIETTFGAAAAEEWLDDRYAILGIADRQRILTVEHLIALEFAGRATAPQLRGMANFYYSKYKFEGLRSDLDRSLYYALLGAERGNNRFQYLNDLGFIYMELAERNAQFMGEAVRLLNDSKGKQPHQQRCYYNLAVIRLDEAKKERENKDQQEELRLLEVVKALLTTALQEKNWESQPSAELVSLVHYNLACCLCLIYAATATQPATVATPMLDEAMKHLKEACKSTKTKLATLDGDLEIKTNGDLCALVKSPHYAGEVKATRDAFAVAAQA
jgi:hypothetical protein